MQSSLAMLHQAVTILPMEKRYLTVKETAEKYNLGVSTVRKHIRDGLFPSVKIGGKILIPLDKMDSMLEGMAKER